MLRLSYVGRFQVAGGPGGTLLRLCGERAALLPRGGGVRGGGSVATNETVLSFYNQSMFVRLWRGRAWKAWHSRQMDCGLVPSVALEAMGGVGGVANL